MVRLKFFRSSTAEENYFDQSVPLSTNDPSHPRSVFAHANTEPRRLNSPHQHFSLAASKNATAESRSKQTHRHRLSSVMQLFEENPDSIPLFKTKANGAIVINRTYHSSKKTCSDDIDLYVPPPVEESACSQYSVSSTSIKGISSWTSSAAAASSYEDEDEDVDEAIDNRCFPPTTTSLNPPPRPGHINKSDIYFDACETLTSYSKELVDLTRLENQRLRDQLSRERQEDRTKLLESNEALSSARREVRYLQRMLSCTQILNSTATGDIRRRQSTGGATANVKRELRMDSFSSFCRPSSVSYEHKLKILLNEIEAMQLEDDQLQAKLDQVEQKNRVLKQALLDRDETIRQLEFDLQVASLNG